MSGLRVVLANEPAVYREVISSAIAVLRPDFEVFTVEPEYLDRELLCLGPRLVVVCSRLTELVQREALAWVQLYPCGASNTLVALDGGRPTKVAHMDLDTLLGVLDVADRLYRREGPGVRTARDEA
jgi:hypothetical protein